MTASNWTFRNILGWMIKIIITVLAGFFLYTKLHNNQSFYQFLDMAGRLHTSAVVPIFSAVILLTALNWLCEAYKWRMMIATVYPISYRKALKAVLLGISLGTVTPGRIGDFGARIAFLPPSKRIQGAVVLGVGAYAQFIMTSIAASIALPVFIYTYIPGQRNLVYIMLFTTPAWCVLMLFLYFNIGALDKLVGRIRFMARHRHFFNVLTSYTRQLLLRVFGISVFRFCILVVQYFLLVNLLVPSVTFPQVMLMITLLFATQTILPSIDLFDIGLRGVAAAYLFGFVTDNIPAILAVVAAIWFINLIIPSVIGLLVIVKTRYGRAFPCGRN